jgi:hypothetical protein
LRQFCSDAKEGNEEGVDFYILLCIEINFIIEEPFTYPWGQTFHASDIIMAGKYYQNWGWIKFTYVLLMQSCTTYIHACHVRVIKFPMLLANYKVQGNELVYKLSPHVEDGIRHATVSIEL